MTGIAGGRDRDGPRGGRGGGRGGRGEARDGGRRGRKGADKGAGKGADKATAGRGGRRGGTGRARDPEQELAELSGALAKVLGRMPEAQAQVLRWRMGLVDGQPHTTQQVATELGLSLSETREIEARAFSHIRDAIPVEHLQRFLDGKGR